MNAINLNYYIPLLVKVFFTCCIYVRVFSVKVTLYIITEKYEKYNTVESCPNSMKGDSTCLAPNWIKIT